MKDAPDQQKVGISNGHGITQVEIHIVSTYQAIGAPPPPVAISEIELFSREVAPRLSDLEVQPSSEALVRK